MTKLEEKLIDLGYEYVGYNDITCEHIYVKSIENVTLSICYVCYLKTCYGICETNSKLITQNKINLYQQAYNQLQKDLEVLKEYEN